MIASEIASQLASWDDISLPRDTNARLVAMRIRGCRLGGLIYRMIRRRHVLFILEQRELQSFMAGAGGERV